LPEPFNRPKLDVCSNMGKIPISSFPVKTSIGALAAQQSGESETCIRDDEIPEGIDQNLNSNINAAPSLSLPRPTSTEAPKNQQPAVASHLPPSFRKCFSQKVRSNGAESASQSLSKTSLQPSDLPVQESLINKSSSKKETSSAGAPFPANLSFEPTGNGKHVAFCASPACFPPSCPPATPSKELDAMNSENGSPTEIAKINSTPAKLASTPARLMNVTPGLHPPKRCYMSPDDDSTSSPNKLARRPPRSRSLKFDTPIKNENIVDEIDGTGGVSVDNDIFDILPENLLQSVSPIIIPYAFLLNCTCFLVISKSVNNQCFFFFFNLFWSF
jgi:chromatin licensing and DNA replication factor 1